VHRSGRVTTKHELHHATISNPQTGKRISFFKLSLTGRWREVLYYIYGDKEVERGCGSIHCPSKNFFGFLSHT